MKNKVKYLLVLLVLVVVIVNTKSNVSNLQAKTTTVAINEKNFPDKHFRNFIKMKYDKNKDGKLSLKEINAVTTMVIDENVINNLELSRAAAELKSLNGLKKFSNLRKLVVNNNKIETLYLLSPKLEIVSIECPKMKHFRLSGGDNLKKVILYRYQATDKLNLQNYKNLECLSISADKHYNYNNLKLSNCKKLKRLNLFNNVSVSTMDLSCFPSLEFAYVEGSVKKLNATNLKKLETLVVSDLGLEEINVKGCSKLDSLTCHGSKLKKVDVTGLNKLTSLVCDTKTTVKSANKNVKIEYR